DGPELIVGDRRREPAVLRPGLEEEQIQSLLVQRHVDPPARQLFFASWMARHTRSGEAGMSSWRTPTHARASTTAFITAGPPPTGPAPPPPLAAVGVRFLRPRVPSDVN